MKNIFRLYAYGVNSIFVKKDFYEYFDYNILMKLKEKVNQKKNEMCDGNICLVDKFIENYEVNCNDPDNAFIKVQYLGAKRKGF